MKYLYLNQFLFSTIFILQFLYIEHLIILLKLYIEIYEYCIIIRIRTRNMLLPQTYYYKDDGVGIRMHLYIYIIHTTIIYIFVLHMCTCRNMMKYSKFQVTIYIHIIIYKNPSIHFIWIYCVNLVKLNDIMSLVDDDVICICTICFTK